MIFDKCTEKAQEAIHIALNDLTSEFNQNQLDAEHILWGLLKQERGLVSDILKGLGINVDSVLSKTKEEINKIPQVHYEYGGAEKQV
ncbi:ATP-dependent Clp protease ATP-binding subunit, partial [candidate division WOR-3 bacterium]|nr:ATP-dependent Clp protease ATP-binding subunit [candidate division WOR-3 bacterium]